LLVQRHLGRLGKKELQDLSSQLTVHIPALMTDRFASYVLVYLIEAEKLIFDAVAKLVSGDFGMFAFDEYSSRVIQRMSSIDTDFSNRCFELAKPRFSELISSFSGSMLLTKLVTGATSEAQSEFLLEFIDENKHCLKQASFNRILNAFVSRCPEQTLDRLVRSIKQQIWPMMNDKFGVWVIQTIYARRNARGVFLINSACIKHINSLIIRRYPKLMLINLIEKQAIGELPSFYARHFKAIKSNQLPMLLKRESLSVFLLMMSMAPAGSSAGPLREMRRNIETHQLCHKVDADLLDCLDCIVSV